MFIRTILILLFASFSGVRALYNEDLAGLTCSVQGVDGICVTMDSQMFNAPCHALNGFLEYDVNSSGAPVGYPPCGTDSGVLLKGYFKVNM